MHVPGRDERQTASVGQVGEGVVRRPVERTAVVEELDDDAVAAERLDEQVEFAAGGIEVESARAAAGERLPNTALAASGQRDHAPGQARRERILVIDRFALFRFQQDGAASFRQSRIHVGIGTAKLRGRGRGPRPQGHSICLVGICLVGAAKLCLRDSGRHGVVAGCASREQQQVRSLGVGHAVLWRPESQRELGAEDRADAGVAPIHRFGGLGQMGCRIEAVVIGDGERVEPEPGGLFEQVFGR